MVEIHQRRGIQIPAISVESQLKILEVRRDIEALCVNYAASRGSVEEKQQMLMVAEQVEACADLKDDLLYASLLIEIHTLLVYA
ncbi:FCD domain-containing protein, partial [Vibrio owensii]